jgi:hypothetical protein
MSMSVLHTQNLHLGNNDGDLTEGNAVSWIPQGPVGNASYTRVECDIHRNTPVEAQPGWPIANNTHAIPHPWTNNTYAITMGYRTFWNNVFEQNAAKNRSIFMPTGHDLLRFYQAYFITADTIHSNKRSQVVSVWKNTVQISIEFVTILGILAVLAVWETGRKVIFTQKNKDRLEKMGVPDGKVDWMVYNAKSSAENDDGGGLMLEQTKAPKDRDYFRHATFGYRSEEGQMVDVSIGPPRIARVYSNRASAPGAAPFLSRGLSEEVPSCPDIQTIPMTTPDEAVFGTCENQDVSSPADSTSAITVTSEVLV